MLCVFPTYGNQHGCSPLTTGECFHLIILSVKHFFLSFFPSVLEKGEQYVTLSLLRGQVVIADVVCSKHMFSPTPLTQSPLKVW